MSRDLSHAEQPSFDTAPTATAVVTERPANYQPPRLEALGRWEAVTLIGSVGFNLLPGMGPHDQ